MSEGVPSKSQAGDIGVQKATEAARAIGAKPAVPVIGESRRESDTDFNDLRIFIGPEAVQRCINEAESPQRLQNLEEEIARLAGLSRFEYERARRQAAKQLGVRAPTLDKIVLAKRAELGLGQDNSKQGRAIALPEPEPWPEPVDGVAMLEALAKTIGAYVIMPEHSRDAIALWTVHTYLLDQTFISPRLAIRSPTKQCGKTTLIDVLAHLVAKPLRTDSVTPSALFRIIAAHRPTILIDEADAFARDNDELRGILNSGHRQGGHVLRNVGDEHEPRAF